MASAQILLLLIGAIMISCVSAQCTPGVTSSTLNTTATLFMVSSCGSSSPSWSFTVTSSFATVSFDAQPFLRGPLVATDSTGLAYTINAPQYSAVFGPGTYSLQLQNYGSDAAWLTNVTVNQIAVNFSDEDNNDDTYVNATRLRLGARARAGTIFPSFDVDWYRITLGDAELVFINGTSDFAGGSPFGVMWNFYTASGAAAMTSLLGSAPNIEQYYYLQPGSYYIRVDAGTLVDQPIGYHLSLQTAEKSCSITVSQCFA